MTSRKRLGARARHRHDLFDGTPAAAQVDRPGFDAGQLDHIFDEVIKPVSLFVDDFKKFAPRFVVERDIGLVQKRRHRGLDRSERRAQVVRDGVEQRRLQPLALFEDFGLPRAFGGGPVFGVQALDLAPARFGLFGAPFGPRRQRAGGQRSDQKRRQRHPVLRIGDGKCVNRREKEEVKTYNAQQRREERRSDAPTRSRKQHDQQQRQRHCRRAQTLVKRRQRDGHGGDATNRENVTARFRPQTCRPTFLHTLSFYTPVNLVTRITDKPQEGALPYRPAHTRRLSCMFMAERSSLIRIVALITLASGVANIYRQRPLARQRAGAGERDRRATRALLAGLFQALAQQVLLLQPVEALV